MAGTKSPLLIRFVVLGCVFAGIANAQTVTRETRQVTVDGMEREYLLLSPNRSGTSALPLVFNFHGSGGSPEGQLATSDFERIVSEYGFVAVLPQGAYTNTRTARSWNADLDPNGVNDVEMVRSIIADVGRDHRIDPTRIYSTGFSGGARMTSRLACELSDVLAAVAPVGGIQFGASCEPQRAIAVLTFHGQADRVNHYVPTADSAPYWANGVEESIERWIDINECAVHMPRVMRISQTVEQRNWSGCRNEVVVEAWIIEDGGHTWPGSPLLRESEGRGVTNHDIDASDLIWQFFARFSRADPGGIR
jgi:polyhydroxybutyrate depolymerase